MIKSILLLFTITIFTSFINTTPKKVIFFGDSITQAGVGPTGYITKLRQLIEKKGETNNYEIIGAGIGGNKVYDLYLRMEEDVLAKKPDMVVIYIGVNDVWHKKTYGTGTDLDKFEKFYQAIINKLIANNIKIALATPACIGERTDFSNDCDGDLNQYSKTIRNLAQKNNLKTADLRKIFLDYNMKHNSENNEKGILTTDRVHLNDTGNQVVAESMYDIIK